MEMTVSIPIKIKMGAHQGRTSTAPQWGQGWGTKDFIRIQGVSFNLTLHTGH